MTIVKAGPDDLGSLVDLFAAYLHFYEVPRAREEVDAFLAERMRLGDSVILLARTEAGDALGFIQLYAFHASLAMKPAWLLSDLFVSENARRQGVAEALMGAARQHALDTGACGIQLETAHTNLAGQALYEKLGYVRDQVFYTYWLSL